MVRRTYGAVLVVAGSLALAPLAMPISGEALVATASARDGYTRKLVKGKWVTGHFSDGRKAGPTKAAGRTGGKSGSARHRLATRSARPPAGRTVAAPGTPPPRPSLPEPTATPPARVAAPASPPPAPFAPRRDDAALTTASLAPPDALKETMRPALEAHARTLANGPAAAGQAREPLPILLPPRTVTLDLERGTRTVVYGDDIVVSEPYDPGRMRDLARPASK